MTEQALKNLPTGTYLKCYFENTIPQEYGIGKISFEGGSPRFNQLCKNNYDTTSWFIAAYHNYSVISEEEAFLLMLEL